MSVHELTFLRFRQSRRPQKNFKMEEWPWPLAKTLGSCPSIIDAGLSSSVAWKEHRIINPGPAASQLPESITVRVLQGDLCAQPCARWGSTGPARGCRLKTEAPNWGIPRRPQEVCPGGPWLHKAGRAHPAGLWFFDQRRWADWRELTTIRRAGSTTETLG